MTLLCWLTLHFDWHYCFLHYFLVNISFLVDNSCSLTLLLSWHYHLVNISFCWHYILFDIAFWLTLPFVWHCILVDIAFWLTLYFGWHCLLSLYAKFRCSRLSRSWGKVSGGGGGGWVGAFIDQLPSYPNLGLVRLG